MYTGHYFPVSHRQIQRVCEVSIDAGGVGSRIQQSRQCTVYRICASGCGHHEVVIEANQDWKSWAARHQQIGLAGDSTFNRWH